MFWLKSRRSLSGTSSARAATPPCAPWWRSPGYPVQPLTTFEPTHEYRGCDEHRAAAPHEPYGASDVLRSGRPAVAEGRRFPNQAAIGVGTAESQAQSAREGGLDPAGVGARRERAVAPGGLEGTEGPSGDRSRHQGRDPGRREVGEVVEPGGGPAELLVGISPVADHRVQCVHRSVRQRTRRAEDEAVEHRGHGAVARILGYRFHGRADDLGGREVRRVPADHLCSAGAGPREIPFAQLALDGTGGLGKAAHREGGGDQERAEDPPGDPGHNVQYPTGREVNEGGDREGQQDAREPPGVGILRLESLLFEGRDRSPHPDRRMQLLGRLAEEGIQEQRRHYLLSVPDPHSLRGFPPGGAPERPRSAPTSPPTVPTRTARSTKLVMERPRYCSTGGWRSDSTSSTVAGCGSSLRRASSSR